MLPRNWVAQKGRGERWEDAGKVARSRYLFGYLRHLWEITGVLVFPSSGHWTTATATPGPSPRPPFSHPFYQPPHSILLVPLIIFLPLFRSSSYPLMCHPPHPTFNLFSLLFPLFFFFPCGWYLSTSFYSVHSTFLSSLSSPSFTQPSSCV